MDFMEYEAPICFIQNHVNDIWGEKPNNWSIFDTLSKKKKSMFYTKARIQPAWTSISASTEPDMDLSMLT